MNKPSATLTKICSSCGIQKPLAAFLQLGGEQGATYGNICSYCRKTEIEKERKRKSDAEGGASSFSGHTIDSKTKVKSDIDKKAHRDHIDELNEEESEKDELIKEKTIEKVGTKAKEEKEHRESYLDKRTTVDSKESVKSVTQQLVARKEAEEKKVNFSAPFMDTYIAGKIKHGAEFSKVMAIFGRKSHLTTSFEKTAQAAQKSDVKPNAKEGADLKEFTDENFSPRGPRSRGS